MSSDKEITVESGAYYKVSEGKNKFYVYVYKSGTFSYGYESFGESDSMSNALELIKAHSGSGIKKIKDI